MKKEIWKDTIALSRILLIVTFIILFSGIAHFLILSPARAQVYCSNLQKVQVTLKPVVIVTQVTASCSSDCQCLRESNAAANLGSSYEKCSGNPCAYDSDGTAKYCFRSVVKVQPQISPVKVAPVVVTLTTTPIPMPDVKVIPVTTTPVPLVAPVVVTVSTTPIPMPGVKVVTGTTTPVPLVAPVVVTLTPTPIPMPDARVIPVTTTPVPLVAPVAVTLTTTPIPMPDARVVTATTTPVPLVAPVVVTLTTTPIPMPDARITTATTTPVPLSGVVQSVAAAKLFTSKEVFSALQIAVGKLPYSADLDINHDGKVDSSDAREILKISVKSPGGVVSE